MKNNKINILKKANEVEIAIGVSAVIPVSDYDNQKPFYSIIYNKSS